MNQSFTPPHFKSPLKCGILSDHYWVIYLIAIIEASFSFLIPDIVVDYIDTPSYFDAWRLYDFTQWTTLVHFFRTPVYPLFIGITSINELLPHSIIAGVQWLVFIISIRYFNHLLSNIIHSKSIIFWITFFYTIYPGIIEVNYYIMTESLSQSIMVFFLYFVVQVIRRGSFKSYLISSVWLLILEFLRPSFIYLLPIYIVICIYGIFKGHKKSFYGLLFSSIIVLSLVGYMKTFQTKYGYFATSCVSTYNNYVRCLYYNFTDEDCYDETIKKYVLKPDSLGHHKWQEHLNPQRVMGTKAFYDGVNTNIATHKWEFLDATIQSLPQFWRSRASQCFTIYSPLCFYINMGMDVACLLVVVYGLVLLYSMVRYKFFSMISFIFLTIWISQAIVSWLGAYACYDRLMQPTFPLLLCMLSQLCSFYHKDKNGMTVFNT